MTALLWLRRDLRVHDHPALHAALANHDHVIPVFCFDPRLLHGPHASGPRTQFLLDCLADLDRSLRRRGSGLVLRHGRPEHAVTALAHHHGAATVFWTEDVSPFATTRDLAVRRALERVGVKGRSLPGLFAVDDPASLRTAAGGPYRMFTPFHRAWLRRERRAVLPAPRQLPPLPVESDQPMHPTLDEIGLKQTAPDSAHGGERAGRRAVDRFLSHSASGYSSGRNELGAERSSRLSPFLHFGCVSARELEQRLGSGDATEAFRRQLCWRDFYAQVLAHFPDNARREFQVRYRGTIRWSRAAKRFEAWCEGRTGYPLIDAAMRQLQREGWMHNRGRLAAGSFLTKDLGIDWRWGERWFMRMLIDGDEANNNGNWQWIASVGVDPQPPSRRLYNPTRQQRRFDPDGAYVRRYLPELRDVPDRYLAEPWTMPRDVQVQSRCIVGKDYPLPIVDHAAARRAALARYAEARS